MYVLYRLKGTPELQDEVLVKQWAIPTTKVIYSSWLFKKKSSTWLQTLGNQESALKIDFREEMFHRAQTGAKQAQ